MTWPRRTTRNAVCLLAGWLTLGHAGATAGQSPGPHAGAPLTQFQRAYVAEDEAGEAWTIGNDSIALQVGHGPTGGIAVLALDSPATGLRWDPAQLPDHSFLSSTTRLTPGQSSFAFRGARAETTASGVQLVLTFEDPAHRLRVTRFYACSPTAAAIETWSVFEATGVGTTVPLSDIGVWQASVQARDVSWITGADDANRFTIQHETLASRGSFALGSTTRASKLAVPVLWLAGSQGHLFSGLMWSGAWGVTVDGPSPAGRVSVRWTAGNTATSVRSGQPVESPHAFFGIAGSSAADVTLALRTFIDEGVRRGRPLEPLVTYNTWFAYGIDINEERMRAEADQAAALGVELFVLDAGWYAGGTSTSDFDSGLGIWKVDARRFPSGLRALGDYVRSRGMKFGIWMEPERVDTRLLSRAGMVSERALATTGGRYNAGMKNTSATAAQVCLADTAGRQWVLDQVTRVIDEARPDYLKWDNNYWINCDRAGHGHESTDGNFWHVTGLYDVLAELRERYPDLIIENCAGGGRRLDFGMLRHTDVGWMDDTTAPSAHVRHNLQGLGAVFPPAYLLSFVIDHAAEPIHHATDMSLYFRSRMGGVLGLTLRGEEFGQEDVEQMVREVSLAKDIRALVPDAAMVTLTDQAAESSSNTWDAVQLVSGTTGTSVLLAFAGAGASDSTVLRMKAFDPDTRYEIRTVGGRHLADAVGTDLMDGGVRVFKRRGSSAGLVLVVARHPAAGSGSR